MGILMFRRFTLAAVLVAAVGALGWAPSASAVGGSCVVNAGSCSGECDVNTGTCNGGADCDVNLGNCSGDCPVNAGTCGGSGTCLINVGSCQIILPQEISDVLQVLDDIEAPVTATLVQAEKDVVDPIVCPVLATLAPGIPGVVDIAPEGDTTVVGVGPYWDCPPYGNLFGA
jgi:hypothetical protein